ncbi:MAG: bifunctional aspartate kinase/homoserine dehydrogenase I [Siphonobacter sp.]
MKVLKFGGTSVGSIKAIESVLGIIHDNLQRGEKIAVVFSAMGGFTNQLLEMGNRAARNEEYRDILKKASDRHLDVVNHFIGPRFRSRVIADVMSLFNELEDLLRGISLIREISPRTSDLLVSFGERLSTTVVAEILKDQHVDCAFLDARKVIKTNAEFQQAEVNFEMTNHLIQHHFSKTKALQLITGFIGSTEDGITTTLGRGGSDYTGSIFGSALNASVIEIWTDVPGMMTSDPRKVKNAFTIPVVSYAEAMELTHFGAKVIYPPSLTPAFKANIPIKVLNTFDPSHPGTIVTRQAPPHEYIITGISSIDNLALVNLQGSGMIGVAGVSAKLFTVLARYDISVILISQASSEHSICFAIDPKFSTKVRDIIETDFANELRTGDIEGIDIQENLSVIAVVGEGMRRHTGVSGRLFSVLGKNGINIVATAQGSSELNISVVIERKDLSKALNVIHESFFADQIKTLNIFLMGTGLIGKTLLHQLDQQETFLRNYRNIKIRLIAVTNSRKMLFDEGGISKEHWQDRLEQNGEAANMGSFVERVKELNLPNSIFVDCTANKSIVSSYEGLLEASVSIVTPNKTANAASYDEYVRRHHMALKKGVKFLYETNVGAGLPIINTIQGLIASGDRFLKIEGVFSGTLSYIFNNFRPGLRFAEVVKEAKAKGYTEPDPRDDLSGQDVARKILILAREIGMQVNFEDVEIKPLLPGSCQNAPTVEAFFEELENCNSVFEKWVNDADAKGEKLRYVATLEHGKIQIGLKSVGINHPLYPLEGADNIISFITKRYHDRPLVIKGPGAGAEVTASGVFADIITVGSYLS